jgi:hypothetical protein
MTGRFKVDAHVTWNSEAGRVRGTIITAHTTNVECKGYVHHATKGRAPVRNQERDDRAHRHAQRRGAAKDSQDHRLMIKRPV